MQINTTFKIPLSQTASPMNIQNHNPIPIPNQNQNQNQNQNLNQNQNQNQNSNQNQGQTLNPNHNLNHNLNPNLNQNMTPNPTPTPTPNSNPMIQQFSNHNNHMHHQNLQPHLSRMPSNIKQPPFMNRYPNDDHEQTEQQQPTNYTWNGTDRPILPPNISSSSVNIASHYNNDINSRNHSTYLPMIKHHPYSNGNPVNMIPPYIQQYNQEHIQPTTQYNNNNSEEWAFNNYNNGHTNPNMINNHNHNHNPSVNPNNNMNPNINPNINNNYPHNQIHQNNNQTPNDTYQSHQIPQQQQQQQPQQYIPQPTIKTSSSPLPISYHDQELLENARKLSIYPLKDIALQIKDLDIQLEQSVDVGKSKEYKTTQLEKKRQHHLFALVSLFKTFKISPSAVCPRNIVYLKYVENCKMNNVSPICNAAFGKLVKVFYPGIKTRRLGVRGSSRYNYCGIELIHKSQPMSNSSSMNYENLTKENLNLSSNTDESNINNLSDSVVFEKSITAVNVPKLKFITDYSKSLLEESFTLPIHQFIDNNMKDTHIMIIQKYIDYCGGIINDLKYWNIESFFSRLKGLDFEVILDEKLYQVFDIDNDELLPHIIKVDIHLCRNMLISAFQQGLQSDISSIKPVLDSLKIKIGEILEQLNLKDTILEEKLQVLQKVVKTVSNIEITFSLFHAFTHTFTDENCIQSFYQNYINTNFDNILKQSSVFDDQLENELSDFFKKIAMSIKLVQIQKNSPHVQSMQDIFKLSFELMEDMISKTSFISPHDIILHMSTSGMSIIQNALLYAEPKEHQAWITFISWINAYLTLIAQLGSFTVETEANIPHAF